MAELRTAATPLLTHWSYHSPVLRLWSSIPSGSRSRKTPVTPQSLKTLCLGALDSFIFFRADPRFVPSQWETALLCNDISHWLGAILESALFLIFWCFFLLAATKQLYKWYFPSVRPSVRLSGRLSVTPFSPCSHHRIIMKFSGVITMVKSDVHPKGQGQRSKVKVTEVNTQLSHFRTLTPVWIHIWQWNHAHSWKQHRRGALLFFQVIRQISRSHGSKNRLIWPRLGVSGL